MVSHDKDAVLGELFQILKDRWPPLLCVFAEPGYLSQRVEDQDFRPFPRLSERAGSA